MRKLRRNKKYEEFYESMLTMRERVEARGLEEKRRMTEEQIQGDPSSVSVCRRSCQDVLIVWTCVKSFLQFPFSVPDVVTRPLS